MKRITNITVAIVLLIVSIILLISSAIVSGFYQRFIAAGFIPDMLIAIMMTLSIFGIIAGVFILIEEFYL